MNTQMTKCTRDQFVIFEDVTSGLFTVSRNGEVLKDKHGRSRTFSTQNSARKRISREVGGDFHR